MRDFLDSILAFIGSESLTTEEFETVPEDHGATYSPESYSDLKTILDSRESVSETHERLKAVYRAKGIVITDSAVTPQSNIYIGDEL